MDRLASKNCNKAMCKSCIFRTDGKAVQLAPGRMAEIQNYLIGKSSHECHVTNKTCYGGLTFQATIFYQMGIIPEPTVNSFLETAAKVLNARRHKICK